MTNTNPLDYQDQEEAQSADTKMDFRVLVDSVNIADSLDDDKLK